MENSYKVKRVPIVILFFAFFLVFISFPRFIASIKALYSNTVLVELSAGKTLPESTFLNAQNILIDAINWHDSSDYWRQLSDLKVKYFLAYGFEFENINNVLAEVSATTDLALSLMPVAPYTWYDRAMLDSLDSEEVENTLESLAMSVYVDRINRNLLQARVLFLWGNRANWNDEMRSIFQSQLMLMWELKRWSLKNMLIENPEMEAWLVRSISTSPEELVRLEKLLKR